VQSFWQALVLCARTHLKRVYKSVVLHLDFFGFISVAFWCVWRLLCLSGLRVESQQEAAGLATELESNQITDVMTSVRIGI
jgi:hypothetical protein